MTDDGFYENVQLTSTTFQLKRQFCVNFNCTKKRHPAFAANKLLLFCSTSISPPKTNNFALTDDWLEDDIGMGRKISSSAPKKQSKLKLSSRTSTSKRQRLSIDDDFEVEEKDSTVALEDDSPPIPPVEEDITFVSGMVTTK